MPYDYHKWRVEGADLIENLFYNGNLNFTSNVQVKANNPVTEFPYIVNHGLYTIKLLSEHKAIMWGSPHKSYYGGFNVEPFSMSQYKEEINSLCDSLEIPMESMYLERVEFGVNFTLDISPYTFFPRAYAYKNTRRQDLTSNNKQTIGNLYLGASISRKLYSKLLQGLTTLNIFRLENHYQRNEAISKNGATHQHHLFSLDVIENFVEDLLYTWTHTLYINDSIALPHTLRKEHHERLSIFSNPLYLDQIIMSNKSTFKREKTKYLDLVKDYSRKDTHDEVYKLILDQINTVTES